MPLSGQEQKLVDALIATQPVLAAATLCARQVNNHVLLDAATKAYERNAELIAGAI